MRRSPVAWLAAAAVAAAACASSSLESSWTDPSVAGRLLPLRKVATVAMVQDGVLRRVAEDELAYAIRSRGHAQAEPSYSVLGPGDLADAETVRRRLHALGFDGAVVVRVLDAREKIRADSFPNAGFGWGTGAHGWDGLYDTVRVRTDVIVRVQTDIYAVEDGRLLWSGATRDVNPSDVSELVKDVVSEVGEELRKQGLLPAEPR